MREDTTKDHAVRLLSQLREAAGEADPLTGDGGLTEERALDLRRRFEAMQPAELPGHAARDGRGELAYWRDHGRITGDLMAAMTRRWGGNAALYRRVGELHDVDYLPFPHDGKGDGPRHPVRLVRALFDAGVHPVVCLAVLEHAPYVGCDTAPSSHLSAALSAAEDLATLAALDPPSTAIGDLSPRARELLETVQPGMFIKRERRVRLERDVERYINAPLALVERGAADLDES